MKLDKTPVRQPPQTKALRSQSKNGENFANPMKYEGNLYPPPPSMDQTMAIRHNQRQTEANIPRTSRPQQQPQQHGVTTGNRYNLNCHSCMLVQMGEKVKRFLFFAIFQDFLSRLTMDCRVTHVGILFRKNIFLVKFMF